MNVYLLLDLIAGLLVGWDLLISKEKANRINGILRDWLRPPSNIKQAFKAGIIFAAIAMALTIAYFTWKDLQIIPIENANFLWMPIFFAGFAIGITIQWFTIRVTFFFTKAQQEQGTLNRYIMYSSAVLATLAIILFVSTAQFRYMVALSIGTFYGIAALEFAILLLSFFRWFLTSDPNPMENPRVLARIGLLLFIFSKGFELLS